MRADKFRYACALFMKTINAIQQTTHQVRTQTRTRIWIGGGCAGSFLARI